MPDDTPTDRAAPSASLTIERVAHRYGGSVALEQISVDVAGGELLSLLGPSGCGKTTLLRIIGGFIRQSAGRILVGASRWIICRPTNAPWASSFRITHCFRT